MCTESLNKSTCLGGSFFLSTPRFLNTILGDALGGSVTADELATAETGFGGAGTENIVINRHIKI